MSQEESSRVHHALQRLSEHGWVPLRAMAELLGYRELRGIYQRQRGRNAIPTIKVGGQYRVYEDVVIRTLEQAPPNKREDAQMILRMYRIIQKRGQHNA